MEVYTGQEIECNGNKYEIPFKNVHESFRITNQPPYVILGTTKAGKTTLALDIIKTFGPEVNYIYYVSRTQPTLISNDLKYLPQLSVRDPSSNIYNTIKDIWTDICMRRDAMNIKPTLLTSLLAKLYPSVQMEKFIENYLQSQTFSIDKDKEVAKVEILTRLILDRCIHNENVLNSLTDDERHAVNGCISGSCKTILILDDLSGLLNAVQSSTEFVIDQGIRVKKGKAFITLLKEILTTCRHMNCLCCLFIHDLSVLSTEITKNINNIVCMDAGAYSNIKNLSRFNIAAMEMMAQTVRQTKIFDENKYKYYWMLSNLTSGTVSIGKANLCKNPIKLSSSLETFYNKLNEIKFKEAQMIGSTINGNGWETNNEHGWVTSTTPINFNEATTQPSIEKKLDFDDLNLDEEPAFQVENLI